MFCEIVKGILICIACGAGLVILMTIQFMMLPKEDQEAITKYLDKGGSLFDHDDFF